MIRLKRSKSILEFATKHKNEYEVLKYLVDHMNHERIARFTFNEIEKLFKSNFISVCAYFTVLKYHSYIDIDYKDDPYYIDTLDLYDCKISEHILTDAPRCPYCTIDMKYQNHAQPRLNSGNIHYEHGKDLFTQVILKDNSRVFTRIFTRISRDTAHHVYYLTFTDERGNTQAIPIKHCLSCGADLLDV